MKETNSQLEAIGFVVRNDKTNTYYCRRQMYTPGAPSFIFLPLLGADFFYTIDQANHAMHDVRMYEKYRKEFFPQESWEILELSVQEIEITVKPHKENI